MSREACQGWIVEKSGVLHFSSLPFELARHPVLSWFLRLFCDHKPVGMACYKFLLLKVNANLFHV